jgi:hypothetical protein
MVAAAYKVSFRRPKAVPTPPSVRIPRVARLLALAHQIDAEIRAGRLRDLADAARLAGVSRARMTQVMNLTLLAPEIQEAILCAMSEHAPGERELRAIVRVTLWDEQVAAWRALNEEAPCPTSPPER